MNDMAGQSPENRINTDILFDLTSEDNKVLSESELLHLVNFGQLSKAFDFPGVDGRVYKVYFSALWDDDYLDILQRTTKYAADPILRSRVMRRLKLFKSIQRIGTYDFSDADNFKAKRLLWSVICKMSDIMVQVLEARYNELELTNNMQVMDAVTALAEKIEATKPDELKVKNKEESSGESKSNPESEVSLAPYSAGQEHADLVAQMGRGQAAKVEEAVKAVETQVLPEDSNQVIVTPKKQ
jgi:hypothetical protein